MTNKLCYVSWMPAESCLYGKFTTESDVWSFGVVLWEIFSYGQQPYSGYSNTEVIEMVRSRQLLSVPGANCPAHIYTMMLECWAEMPGQRPPFADLHSRLRSWQAVHARDHRKTAGSGSGSSSNNTASRRLNHYNSNNNAVAYQTTMLADRDSIGGSSGGAPNLPLPPPPTIPPPPPHTPQQHLFGPLKPPPPPVSGYQHGQNSFDLSAHHTQHHNHHLHLQHQHSPLHAAQNAQLQYHVSSATSNSSGGPGGPNGGSRPNTPSTTRAKMPILGHC